MTTQGEAGLAARLLQGTRHYADSVSRSAQFAHTVKGAEKWRQEALERARAEVEGTPLQLKGIGDGSSQVGTAKSSSVQGWNISRMCPTSCVRVEHVRRSCDLTD